MTRTGIAISNARALIANPRSACPAVCSAVCCRVVCFSCWNVAGHSKLASKPTLLCDACPCVDFMQRCFYAMPVLALLVRCFPHWPIAMLALLFMISRGRFDSQPSLPISHPFALDLFCASLLYPRSIGLAHPCRQGQICRVARYEMAQEPTTNEGRISSCSFLLWFLFITSRM